MANNPRFAPWVHHQNSSSTSLSRLGLEKAVPPGQSAPNLPPAYGNACKELPPTPNPLVERSYRGRLSDQSPGGSGTKKSPVRLRHDKRISEALPPQIGSKSHTLPESMLRTHSSHRQPSADFKGVLPCPPPPPMTKSAQKILQLTGFDPSFDREPVSHSPVSPVSSESSGSKYSQLESEIQDYRTVESPQWEAAPMTLTRGERSILYLQSSTYSVSERSASVSSLSVAAVASASVPTSLCLCDHPDKCRPKIIDVPGKDSAEALTNEEFMVNDMARFERQKQQRSRSGGGFDRDMRSRYRSELSNVERKDLAPGPLAIRGKPRVNVENSKFVRQYTVSASPMERPYDGMPICARMLGPPIPSPSTKGIFGSGEHLLKSSFRFPPSQKDSEPGEGEQRFRKRFSGAMKRWSGGRRPPVTQTVIPTSKRRADESDMPISPNFGLKSLLPLEIMQKGNEHLQSAVDKARKGLKIRTMDEKRRENLKKQIVVVGVTDQSPDGRVSEWL